MQTYIALLRGINVSGQKMIKMPELLTLFESLGYADVKTYIQSGNVVFRADSLPVQDLEQQIATKIAEQFTYNVPVLVKSQNEWSHILQGNPFVSERNEDPAKLHVTLLSAEPAPDRIAKIDPTLYTPDKFRILASTVYLYCPQGYGRTKLHNNFFESKLKLSATTRNWKTIHELMQLAEAIA